MLNAEIDGTFPAHHPDPTVPKNLEQLIAAVRENIAPISASPSTATRTGSGSWTIRANPVWRPDAGDSGRDVLKQHPGATIIADVKASQVLFDEIARAGGKPLMWKTGHSLIKSKMAETGTPLAGEMSGHMFFADKLVWLRRCPVLRRATCSASSPGWTASSPPSANALAARDQHARASLRLRRPPQVPVIEEVAARLRAEGAKVAEIDGVRVLTADGWWLLRASNTQAVLVARAEATSEEGLERLKRDWYGTSKPWACRRRISRAATRGIDPVRSFRRAGMNGTAEPSG